MDRFTKTGKIKSECKDTYKQTHMQTIRTSTVSVDREPPLRNEHFGDLR